METNSRIYFCCFLSARSPSLESVQPGASSPVVAAEAFLLWEENETRVMLDLAERGEEVL